MKIAKLSDMTNGWFIGNFSPCLHKTDKFEVAVKFYNKGESEARHYHKIATEYTVIVQGKVSMNDVIYKAGDIIIMEPGEATNFMCLEDNTITAIVKSPSVPDDKYLKE